MSTRPLLLVGGVGQLLQGDLDLGRLAAEQLEREINHPGVVVEDLSYGAIQVAHRLEELRPGAMVLIGAVERGRAPGSMVTRRIEHRTITPEQFQAAVVDMGTGYVGVDLLLDVAEGLGVLPDDTVVIEVEPAETWPSGELTPHAASGLALALQAAWAEIDRVVASSSHDEPAAEPTAPAGSDDRGAATSGRGDNPIGVTGAGGDRSTARTGRAEGDETAEGEETAESGEREEGEETAAPGREPARDMDGEWMDLVSRLLPPPGPTTETWEQLGSDISDLPPGQTKEAGGGNHGGQ